jgi:3-methyladenine DNA glycosylase/8-oxoguanine DNA glycosylase
VASDPGPAARQAESWRPWRSYALQHLWAHLEKQPGVQPETQLEPQREETS